MRIVIGLTGVAAASAIVTALLAPPATDAGVSGTAATTSLVVPAQSAAPLRHVTKVVQLMPGQTAPPQATIRQAPAPKPRVVVVTTRQSGAKP